MAQSLSDDSVHFYFIFPINDLSINKFLRYSFFLFLPFAMFHCTTFRCMMFSLESFLCTYRLFSTPFNIFQSFFAFYTFFNRIFNIVGLVGLVGNKIFCRAIAFRLKWVRIHRKKIILSLPEEAFGCPNLSKFQSSTIMRKKR